MYNKYKTFFGRNLDALYYLLFLYEIIFFVLDKIVAEKYTNREINNLYDFVCTMIQYIF